MTSLILQTAARGLVTLMLLYSVFLLLRVHNEPGGGFSGGLVAASAFTLYASAFGVPWARRLLSVNPRTLIGAGLAVAVASGILPLVLGEPFLTGLWTDLPVPGLGEVAVSNVVAFDIGVFLVVLGVTMLIVLTLAEES